MKHECPKCNRTSDIVMLDINCPFCNTDLNVEHVHLPEKHKERILAMPKKERDKYLQGEWEPVVSDTDRIEALANCGFSIWQIIDNGVESWRCQYKIDEQHEGKTLREAMDKAIIAYRNEQGVSNET